MYGFSRVLVYPFNKPVEGPAVLFHTNLDAPIGGSWSFPKQLTRLPKLGDRVHCYSGGQQRILKVCRIDHGFSDKDSIPYLYVELHTDFPNRRD